jgi:hypothetical protein
VSAEAGVKRVLQGAVQLSPLGQIVAREWEATMRQRPYIESNAAVVMSNHFHAVFTLTREGFLRRGVACYAPPRAGTEAARSALGWGQRTRLQVGSDPRRAGGTLSPWPRLAPKLL